MILPFDSGTLWLNVMNWALGAFTVACIVAVVVAVVRAPRETRRHATLGAGAHWPAAHDIVGLTMADGGAPLEPEHHDQKADTERPRGPA
jgi:hypothetical protein